MTNAYRILVKNPEGKRPLGKSMCRQENNIMMGLKEIGCQCGKWIQLAQDRVYWWAVMKYGSEPKDSIEAGNFWPAE
jgi:hypothetical protein